MRTQLDSGTAVEWVLPDGAPARGVVIAPDIMGLRPLFDDLCARLADEQQWMVSAVEPFPGREDLALEDRLQSKLDLPRTMSDLAAAQELLTGHGCERVAVLGFCMGGMHAFLAAGASERIGIDRAVSFYGMIRLPEQWRDPGAEEPLDALRRPTACPTLAIVGGRDIWAPADDVDELRSLGPEQVEIAYYPAAEHGFVHDPARPAHRPEDAADAWQRVYAFLQ